MVICEPVDFIGCKEQLKALWVQEFGNIKVTTFIKDKLVFKICRGAVSIVPIARAPMSNKAAEIYFDTEDFYKFNVPFCPDIFYFRFEKQENSENKTEFW